MGEFRREIGDGEVAGVRQGEGTGSGADEGGWVDLSAGPAACQLDRLRSLRQDGTAAWRSPGVDRVGPGTPSSRRRQANDRAATAASRRDSHTRTCRRQGKLHTWVHLYG